MKTFSWLLLFGAIAVGGVGGVLSATAQAQSSDEDVFDLKTMTCRDMLRTDGEERGYLMILMHGYINGQNGDTIINAPLLAEATDNIVNSCIDNPDEQLFSVFEEYR